MIDQATCHFSFSGLKTAVARIITTGHVRDSVVRADLAAGFQDAITDVLINRCAQALRYCRVSVPTIKHLVVAGGVAANQVIHYRLAEFARKEGLNLLAPPLRLCTDNGVMVAWAGIERLDLGMVDDVTFKVRPRWPLDPSAPPAIGAGVKA